MLTKEDIETAKEIAKVLRESQSNELTVAGQLITVLLAEREQQRTWVGLSYEEAKEIYRCIHGYDAPKRISEAIEAKLKEKNT
jgi:hypothetical protein